MERILVIYVGEFLFFVSLRFASCLEKVIFFKFRAQSFPRAIFAPNPESGRVSKFEIESKSSCSSSLPRVGHCQSSEEACFEFFDRRKACHPIICFCPLTQTGRPTVLAPNFFPFESCQEIVHAFYQHFPFSSSLSPRLCS